MHLKKSWSLTLVYFTSLSVFTGMSVVCQAQVPSQVPAQASYPVALSVPVAFSSLTNYQMGDKIPGFSDSIPHSQRINWQYAREVNKPFPLKSLILPAAMISYGFAALNSNHLKSLNKTVKEEVWTEDPHKKLTIDNYTMYVPAVAVYALNLAGIQGKHNFRDRSIILLMSNLIAQGTVFTLKGTTHQLRPDGSAYNSFPSGHTAEAFVSAEFMRQEYKDVSPWYGVAGYAVATATGMLRMYNNKHWLSDVVTGAGVGIASTRIAYWLYPVIQHAFFKDKAAVSTMVMPTYQNGTFGLQFAKQF
ncbi:phosphatase PAP2 family protein [Flavitalea flava]